ncbi:MAG: hypothetical protein RLZZ89_1729, partial [Cyanobacteriota bacterium]
CIWSNFIHTSLLLAYTACANAAKNNNFQENIDLSIVIVSINFSYFRQLSLF